MKLQQRLTLLTSLVLISSLAIIMSLTLYLARQSLDRSIHETLLAISQGSAKQVDQDIQLIVAQLTDIGEQPALQAGQDSSAITAVLRREQQRLGTLDNISYILPDGSATRSNGTKSDVKNRSYFTKALQSKQPVISDVLISGSTGKASVIVAVPLVKNGQVHAILGGTLPLQNMLSMINEIRYKQTGHAFLADDSGMLLNHPQQAELAGQLNLVKPGETSLDPRLTKAFQAAAEQGTPLTAAYTFLDGITYEAVFTPITLPGNQRWVLVLTIAEQEIFQPIRQLLWLTCGLVLLCLLLGVAASFRVGKHLSRPLQALQEQAQAIAAGDLRQQLKPSPRQDEIGQLTNSIAAMAEQLGNMLRQIEQQTMKLSAASNELNHSNNDSAAASTHLADIVSALAADTDTQAGAINAIQQQMTEITQHMQASVTTGTAMQDTAQQTVTAATAGQSAVQLAKEQMGNVQHTIAHSTSVIHELEQQSQTIGTIIDTIHSLANQTNLLALNAAIEAARAGAQGRSFAVVADEVRKLAEQSQTATQEIAAVITAMQAKSHQAVTAIQTGQTEVATGVSFVDDAAAVFQRIFDCAQTSGTHANRLHEQLQQIRQQLAALQQEMGTVQQVSQQTNAHAQSIAGTAEEQAASLEQTAAVSDTLSQLAASLQTLSQKFRLP